MDESAIQRFSKPDQILNVAAELSRAAHWQNDREIFLACLARAIELINAIGKDPKWRDNPELLASLKDALESVRIGRKSVEEVLKVL